jgi:hypothetical protein
VKLNEFKKAKLNELDLSSFLGDYGSAAVKTGLGSLMGKNVLSTSDQMAKDQFVKNFTSRAFSGLQSAINSGLVNPAASSGMSGANIGTNMGRNPQASTATQDTPTAGRNVSPTPAQKRGAANKAGANAFDQMANQLTAQKSPEQIRKEKQAAAAGVAQQQMANNGPFSKLPANQAAVQAGNIRQQKQSKAATAAQDQMAPMSKLPADQFAKTATTTRQNQQATATQTAQDQMAPMSKLPADQFAKTTSKLRTQKQGQSATNAQDQMAPMSKLPADQFAKTAADTRKQKQAAAMQKAQNQMASPAATEPKPDNTIQMPKRIRKPKGKVAESRFEKLDYLFESILNEATMAQTIAPAGKVVGQANQQQSKQSISQYITNFFKQFMKGVNITDPSVMTQVNSLAKELEQNYAKDKGKSVLPKLADLGWSVSHAQAEEQPNQAVASTKPTPTTATSSTPQPAQAATQQAKMTATQIKKLMQGMSVKQKQAILKSLETELNSAPAQKQATPSKTVKMPKVQGAKAGLPTPDEQARFQQRIQQAQQK